MSTSEDRGLVQEAHLQHVGLALAFVVVVLVGVLHVEVLGELRPAQHELHRRDVTRIQAVVGAAVLEGLQRRLVLLSTPRLLGQ
eukprot:3587756-Heterocapsa_arctica.AAC.1